MESSSSTRRIVEASGIAKLPAGRAFGIAAYYSQGWRRHPPDRSAGGRATARWNGRSAPGCTVGPGCSSRCRSSSPRSASPIPRRSPRGRIRPANLSTVAPGSSPDTIVVMAHRDNTGTSPGANDNASGTAALIELARGYANVGGGRRATPAHRILFLSTDAGAFGGLGAEPSAARAAGGGEVAAVVTLDAPGGVGRPRLETGGAPSRSPAASL